MPEPRILLGRPNPTSIPVADRCTINRLPAPGSRPADPFPGRLRFDPSQAAIEDKYATQTLEAERTIAAGEVVEVDLGPVAQPCVQLILTIYAYAADDSVLDFGATRNLLIPVQTRILKNNASVVRLNGTQFYGIALNVDFRGGENLSILVDNTDARSTLDGQTLFFQVMLLCDPTYAIETGRKDNPIP
jgi:hypothetical protein